MALNENDNIPNSNASKNLDAMGKPLYPSSYVFRSILMIKEGGKEVDIQKIVTSLTIVEEIYSPLLTARIRIRDNENFFDKNKLSGQEIVRVTINYLPDAEAEISKDVTYEFVVKDYPLFDKTTESINVQEYEINLVSSYAYLSRLQQISLGIKGNPIENIKQIFNYYLGDPTFESKERFPCIINDLKAVITQKTPLQAVEFLKGTCYDEYFSPFFIYTTLQDSTETGSKIIARSWADILDNDSNPVYYAVNENEPYSLRPFEKDVPGTPEYRKRLKTKIIRFKSNIKLDKLTQAINGGIGSVTEVVDLNERTYTEERSLPGNPATPRVLLEQREGESSNFRRVAREDQDPFLGLLNRGSETFQAPDGLFDFKYLENIKINGERPKILNTILDEPRTNREVYYIPVDPYGQAFRSSSEIKKEALKDTKLYKANMDATSHELVTYGDLNLKAGGKIEIEIPKAVDTNKEEGGIDANLSGVYIISTAVHEFAGGVYTNQLKIIREGPPDEIIAMNTTGQDFNPPQQIG